MKEVQWKAACNECGWEDDLKDHSGADADARQHDSENHRGRASRRFGFVRRSGPGLGRYGVTRSQNDRAAPSPLLFDSRRGHLQP